ncbi:hypothetical protein Pmar_PMAR023899 [Perkinsus marinus ATCC 50983]|uniref:Uncharacterized protein n=1 Tax=Perkinsus marinus (strain ATCC 50983 / TXsc) TaxID=423536 RepID=C5LRF6_PERM5|nr:hypothetical protein Pmar_PMAR023899 [Perkinsus marinus ATCC 50983]EER00688.1 hypothetical protein Pmar_PMAR023899 [Perkinsus marinus ATCC 50983]|eukprot:XP_002767970.1 hypothetical protein Pmar_PMAR023899 [Perkinsus marinus ATCC 50983]
MNENGKRTRQQQYNYSGAMIGKLKPEGGESYKNEIDGYTRAAKAGFPSVREIANQATFNVVTSLRLIGNRGIHDLRMRRRFYVAGTAWCELGLTSCTPIRARHTSPGSGLEHPETHRPYYFDDELGLEVAEYQAESIGTILQPVLKGKVEQTCCALIANKIREE